MSNLALRVIVAVVAIPLIVAACYFGGPFFFLFTTILIVMSANEFYALAHTKGIEPAAVLGITSAGVLNAIVYAKGLGAAFEFILVVLVVVLLFELGRKRTQGITGVFSNAGTTITGIVYIGLFGAMLTAIRQRVDIRNVFPADREAGLFIISILATIWICDSAAYFVGIAIGRHKMSTFVSPNKSWEGAVAGFIFAVVTSVSARYIALPRLDIRIAVGLGIIVGTVGQAGDFVESLFKRDAGAKDSSSIIPGHGGVFDRFDSLIFSAPVVYLLLRNLK